MISNSWPCMRFGKKLSDFECCLYFNTVCFGLKYDDSDYCMIFNLVHFGKWRDDGCKEDKRSHTCHLEWMLLRIVGLLVSMIW
jgi:hypothetical protein